MPTTRRVHLLRHAKSSWDDGGRSDHERPLAPRGHRACAALADHLRSEPIGPDVVLCSTAVRARETLDGIRDALLDGTDVRFDDELYGASTSTLLARLRGLGDGVASVLVIGHNPGIGALAARLAGSGDPGALDRLRRGYPTAALTSLRFDGGWSDLGPERAVLEAFLVPRELD